MSQATEMLSAYLTAETALLQGKEARMGDRALRMEDLAEIRAGRKEWEQRVAAETAASSSTGKATVGSIGGRGFSVARMDK